MRALFAWGLVGWLASAAFAATGRERAVAIYPPQRMPLAFDHAKHLAAGADCVTCHDSARKSTQAADLLLPRGSADEHPDCDPCHDIQKAKTKPLGSDEPPSRCIDCHLGFDETVQREPPRIEFPSPNILFPHKVHVDAKVKCETCHGTMKDIGLATRFQLPKMETCLVCHDNTYASADCKTCHLSAPSGRIQLTFTTGVLRPMQGNPYGMDHGPPYEFTHGTRAKLDRATCMQCHIESECLKCHDGLVKPLSIHPNDYIALHPVEARMDTPKCDSCHRYQSFCAACHERVGIGLSGAAFFRSKNVRIHPDYQHWVVIIGPQHHAFQAARNIQECLSCHRQEDCLPCHSGQLSSVDGITKLYGAGVDPHPNGFQGICGGLLSKNPRPCLLCHVAGAPEVTTLCKH